MQLGGAYADPDGSSDCAGGLWPDRRHAGFGGHSGTEKEPRKRAATGEIAGLADDRKSGAARTLRVVADG